MAKQEVSLTKVSVNSPQAMAKFATTLKDFIVAKKLYSNIKGKNYVNVEGWEFAGAAMGIFPIVRSTENLSTDKEVKYKARVELVTHPGGKVVGAGEAICSGKEKSKTSFEEYAIASMAQTRAIGKAYRNAFGWLMKMAGYEPTTAEEMDGVQEAAPPIVPEDPIEEVRARVQARLDAMGVVDRMRFLKGYGKTGTTNLSDNNWRGLDYDLKDATPPAPIATPIVVEHVTEEDGE